MKIQPFNFGFVTTKYLSYKSGLVLLLGMSFMVAQVFHIQKMRIEVDALQERYNQNILTEQRGKKRMKVTAAMQREIQISQTVIDELSVPWPALFMALEESKGDIDLLSIHPNKDEHEIKLGGVASDINDVLSYIERLKEQQVFSSPLLLAHYPATTKQSERQVYFEIISDWSVTRGKNIDE